MYEMRSNEGYVISPILFMYICRKTVGFMHRCENLQKDY